jgi:filamin
VANRDSKERIVEHVRKNFSLFETDRETYNISPAYANRGHLQSVLVQKQQNPSNDNSFKSSQRQPFVTKSTRLNDQYTQYRASDFVRAQDQQSSSGNRTVVSGEQLEDRRCHKAAAAGDKKSNSLKRSVSSLNGLLKRQVQFVKSRGARSTHPDDRQVEQRNDNQFSAEEQYKIPAKQTFVASSSLYLLPAPDQTVHIATLVVKDIILAHQRAKHREAIKSAQRRSEKPTNRLTKLFKTYSFRKSELESIAQQKHNKQTDNHSLTRSFRSSSSGGTDRQKEGRRSLFKDNQHTTTLDHSVSKIRAKVKMPSGKSEKATIIDNKDGTVKISYEPKEEGAHEISLRYNDEPIDDGPIVFYVDSVGSAKKKITAYGPGLTRGLVGEQNKFTINTGGLGSAKLNVSVEGPSKTQVDLGDNRDGTITVSYVALLPGDYKIKISFDGKQVVGSPFTTEIGDEGRQRSHLNVGRGSEHLLDFKISEDDLKALDAIIVTPCGLEEPAELKLMKNGQLAIMFTPREQGDHLVNVKRRGNHIAGSPFRFDVLSRDIGDAKQVKVSGKGLKEGKANAENEIIINTKDAGYGGLSVALEGPGRSEIVSKEVTDSTIKLSYTPYEPGQYNLIVKYADHVVPGSPFSIKVSGQGTNPQKESIRKFRKLQPVAEMNTECHFSFKLPGVSAYDLSAKIHSPQGAAEDVSVKDKGDFVYQVSFVPKEVGLFALSIRNKEIHIAGSPFPFTVGPLLDFGPHKVRCGGPGLIKGTVNKLNEFDVYTREAGAGELHVVMEGPSKPELKYTDRKDGSCHIGYKVSQPGEYRVSVFFNEHEVPDSPFRAVIMAPTGDISKIEMGPMPPDSMIQLNKPYNMTVIMNGAKGNIEGKVKVPSGKIEDCFASPIDAENWGVRFIPREFGIYQVYIKCKGSHIPQSPLFVRVGHDNADPAAILVHGHGLKTAVVNHATDFIVETCNAGHSMLEVNIEGPSKVSMGCAELDEGYKINYTPLAPGDYLITIKYNGCHIGSSPFKVRATKQPGSKTIADAGSHEISTIAISTTDREAKQKVEHMPKFKSDATRVYCKGMGLKKAFAGKPNTLTVNCSEAGFNMIYASFLGPTRNTIYECSVKHMGGQIYEVKYTCKDKGDAMLMVKYGDEQIPGSPFRLECV